MVFSVFSWLRILIYLSFQSFIRTLPIRFLNILRLPKQPFTLRINQKQFLHCSPDKTVLCKTLDEHAEECEEQVLDSADVTDKIKKRIYFPCMITLSLRHIQPKVIQIPSSNWVLSRINLGVFVDSFEILTSVGRTIGA